MPASRPEGYHLDLEVSSRGGSAARGDGVRPLVASGEKIRTNSVQIASLASADMRGWQRRPWHPRCGCRHGKAGRCRTTRAGNARSARLGGVWADADRFRATIPAAYCSTTVVAGACGRDWARVDTQSRAVLDLTRSAREALMGRCCETTNKCRPSSGVLYDVGQSVSKVRSVRVGTLRAGSVGAKSRRHSSSSVKVDEE